MTNKKTTTPDPRDLRHVALQIQCYAGPPEIGDRFRLSGELEIVDEDGGCSYYDRRAEGLVGTVVGVGGHWSDTPHGRAGWWITYQVRAPAALRGHQLYGEHRAE